MNIDNTTLELRKNTQASRFEVQVGEQTAFIDYEQEGNVYTFTHTEVPPEYRGQGIAARMTQLAHDMLKSEGAKVVPVCPYTELYIEHHPEYQPLLA